jgi:hypothetical protein
MTRLKLAALAAALVVGLSGTSSAQTATPPQKPKAAKPTTRAKEAAQTAQQPPPSTSKTVCVASTLGYAFQVQTIGLMVFGNKLEEAAITSWGVDDIAVQKITAMIGRQYSVRGVTLPLESVKADDDEVGFFRAKRYDLVANLRAVTSGIKCDYIIVLIRASTQYAGTNQPITGLGVVHHDRLNQHFTLFAKFFLRLYDGTSFAVLSTEYPRSVVSIDNALFGADSNAMYRRVDKSWWPATADAAARSDQLKSATRALVEEGLSQSVPELFKPDSERTRERDIERGAMVQ